MDFQLRPLAADDAQALQLLYETRPEQLKELLGRPAAPGQAARDLAQGAETPGRYQMGAILNQQLAGMVDCKLDDQTPDTVHIGLMLLAPAYASHELAALMVRLLGRWFASALGVRRLETAVVAHDRETIALWRSLGFDFTGEQYRRELPGYAPRFLVMAQDLVPERE